VGDPITNEVLAERLEHFRRDQHDDMTRIETQLSKLVPREVYDAHRVADAARLVSLEKRADQLDQERQQDRQRAVDHQRQMLRWVIGAVALPILLAVWQLWLSARGGKP
jgi:hypothetical protein